MTKEDNKTFVKISNHDIYLEIQDLKKMLEKSGKTADRAKYMAGVALALVFLLAGWFFTHLNKG